MLGTGMKDRKCILTAAYSLSSTAIYIVEAWPVRDTLARLVNLRSLFHFKLAAAVSYHIIKQSMTVILLRISGDILE